MKSIVELFAKSPFKPLELHVEKVKLCSDMFRECVIAYCKSDFEKAETLAVEISRIEHEADKIKNFIREHLPKGIFMPVDRGDLLNYLSEQDKVADYIEETALTLALRRTMLSEDLREDFLDLAKKTCDVVDLIPLTVKSMSGLLETSYLKKGEGKIMEYIRLMKEKEELTDQLDLKIRKELFDKEDEFTHGEFFHLMRTIKLLSRIADHAENCGDRMLIMIAKV
jgi:hypothetical protein